MRSTPPSVRRAVLGVGVACLLLAACGGGDGASDASSPSPTGARTPDPSAALGSERADALARVFDAVTPLGGGSFDGATLVGVDSVLWFWAPWCTSCRGEAPEVAEVAARYADQLQVVGVPGRGELDAMRDFVDDTETGAIIHLADLDGLVWNEFGVYGQPAYAFVDDSGEIDVFVGGMGGDALAARIEELVAT